MTSGPPPTAAAPELLPHPDPERDPAGRTERIAPVVLAAGTLTLAIVTVRTVLARAGGPAVPLDDAYIHFQYARSVAELHPFVYTEGAAPTPGATSLLWPLILAPFHAAGLRTESLIWPAWGLGFVALFLLAEETRRLSAPLVRPLVAALSGGLVLAFGGFNWFAASGMEVVPFAWLLTRTVRRSAERMELRGARATGLAPPVGAAPSARELVALAALCPLMRPEGAVGSLLVTAALIVAPPAGRYGRTVALLTACAPALPSVIAFAATGQAALSTAVAKWLPLNPYWGGERLIPAVLSNVSLLFGTLLDGRLWTSVFLPPGGRVIAVLALVMLLVVGARRRRLPRALAILGFALCMLLPATYETFLVNRVRYIWPFAPAWLVGLATLCEACGIAVARTGARALRLPEILATATLVLFAYRLPQSIDDLAGSCSAISQQQVSLGRWARDALPGSALIGVNDTGAIAYFSGHRTFDVVGLTTRGEARHWAAGAGSRFEHYEKLPPSARPTHFIVYPEWFALGELLGESLTSRSVRHSILGGVTMAAHAASYAFLATGAHPTETEEVRGRPLLDEVDVADLESEAAHGYRLFEAHAGENRLTAFAGRADGGRATRTQDEFLLTVAPGGILVVRCGASSEGYIVATIGSVRLPERSIEPTTWRELVFAVPASIERGVLEVRVEGLETTFEALHYWSYE